MYSGICSALFELGGLTVMHDASGCNSTYNTHDEPRWYDMDSMVYISRLSEMEAIMGDDDKLINDIVSTAEQLSPRVYSNCRNSHSNDDGNRFSGYCFSGGTQNQDTHFWLCYKWNALPICPV